jgi:hypothetical protein
LNGGPFIFEKLPEQNADRIWQKHSPPRLEELCLKECQIQTFSFSHVIKCHNRLVGETRTAPGTDINISTGDTHWKINKLRNQENVVDQ